MFAIIAFNTAPNDSTLAALTANGSAALRITPAVCLISGTETANTLDARLEKVMKETKNRYVLFQEPARIWFTNITDEKAKEWIDQKLDDGKIPPPVLI